MCRMYKFFFFSFDNSLLCVFSRINWQREEEEMKHKSILKRQKSDLIANDVSLFGIKASECFTADDENDGDAMDDISEQVFLLLQYLTRFNLLFLLWIRVFRAIRKW